MIRSKQKFGPNMENQLEELMSELSFKQEIFVA